MAAARALFVAAVVSMAAVVGTAHGASYTVGAPSGSWDLRTNYTRWASGINFRAGDQLVFKYSRAAHNVLEVSNVDYDSCSGSSPLATFNTGNDVVPLPAAGVTRYFICGVPGHCDAGMKLAVRVEAAAATGPNAALPSPAPMAPRAAHPPVATPGARAPAAGGQAVPPASSAAQAGVESLVGLGLGVVVAGLMAFY
ncbi:chemocyanin-like [Phragmites australis]|uniref:chemocyanin-like n=1 Tax=Phragmites australis TaxID=29695 RepID=UPI002D79F9FA|nr:chemocyanin-like [Phragmites australis]